ncbi:MAG: hypothetical protein WDN46_12925 [Methylocella sp.]
MEIAVLAIGVILVVTALQNTTGPFFSQLENDLIGQGGFLPWAGLVAVLVIGGKVTGLQSAAKLLLGLLILVYVVKNPTAFSAVASSFQNVQPNAPASQVATGAAETVTGATAAPSTGSSVPPSSPATTPKTAGGGATSLGNIPNINTNGVFGALGGIL